MGASPSTEEKPKQREPLTREDVNRLLQNPREETKVDILAKVADHYGSERLSETERALAEQIFRLLVKDSAVRIRTVLSESLKGNPHIPKDIILILASDEEPVATPVLTMSEVLSDEDIVRIIRNSEEIWRYLAISRRKSLSEMVSGALVDTEQKEVIHAVLEHSNARISEDTLDKLVVKAGRDGELAGYIARRPQLPVAIVDKLINLVSGDIQEQLLRKYQIDRVQLEANTYQVREQSTLSLIAASPEPRETERLVQQLQADGRLTAALVINALCHGNLEFFEISLANMAGIPVTNARLLIGDKGKLGFRAIYEKSGLPGTMFKAVRLLLHSVRHVLHQGIQPGTGVFVNHVIQRMLAQAEHEEVDNLSYVLALLRQHSKG